MFAKSLGDAVAVMDDGRIVHAGAHGGARRGRGLQHTAARPQSWTQHQ